MKLALSDVPLIALFLIPGFLALYIRQNHGHAPILNLSKTGVAVLSILLSALISLIGGVIVFSVPERWMRGFALDPMATLMSPDAYFQLHPVRFSGIWLLWLILTVALAWLVGWADPLRFLQHDRLRGALSRSHGNWYSAFAAPFIERGASPEFAVLMKNGDLYLGLLLHFELDIDDQGNREFILCSVRFVPGDQSRMPAFDHREMGSNSVVVLNTRDTESINAIIPQ